MLGGRPVTCSNREVSIFDPPVGQTCGAYLERYASATGGVIQNPGATVDCHFCSLSNADQFLASVNIHYSERWRNFGILFAFIAFNMFLAVSTYWLFRVVNFNSLKIKMRKSKKEAKVRQDAEKAKDRTQNVVAQGAHPGNSGEEKDAGVA